MLASPYVTNIQKNKIRGCMIGGAVGDALGWPVEFKSEREIFNKYWPDGIKAYVLNSAGEAEITDDTQMALFTANGMLYGKTQNLLRQINKPLHQYVAVAYQDWLYTQEEGYATKLLPGGISWLSDVKGLFHRRAPGGTCLHALRLQNSAPGNISDYVKAELNDSKGCGGIMRVAPIGLMNWPDIIALDFEGAQVTAITHGHPLGYMPSAVLVHIINRLIYSAKEDQTLTSIIVEARDTVSELFKGDPFLPKLCSIINRAVDLAENSEDNDLENIHKLGEGWVAEETLGISLYCALRYQDDFSAGIIASVNHKGDSDSTGAVTGNILGALVGYEAIEDKWKEKLELRDVILEIADDLCRGVPVSEEGKVSNAIWLRKYNKSETQEAKWDARYWEWKNKYFGNYNVLAAFKISETEHLVSLFGEEMRQAARRDDEIFFFLDTAGRNITPMKVLAYAFGGQYNDDPPYGKQIKDFAFQANEYKYRPGIGNR